MTAPAFAETSANYSTKQTAGQEVDLSAVFTNNQNLQVATLSTQEMQETEGAWVNFAVGAGIGFAAYAAEKHFTKQPMTFKGAAFAAGTGALTGGATGALVKAAGGKGAAHAWSVSGLSTSIGTGSYRRHKGW